MQMFLSDPKFLKYPLGFQMGIAIQLTSNLGNTGLFTALNFQRQAYYLHLFEIHPYPSVGF